MALLDRYFTPETSAEPSLHPDARRWQAKLRPGMTARCHLLREREGLAFQPARLALYIRNGDEVVDTDYADWDPRLNDWLVSKRIPSETTHNEAERFGLALSDKFGPIELRYGGGFFNAVLIQHLRRTGFGELAPTKQTLERIEDDRLVQGPSADECAGMINEVIQSCARDLAQKLLYSRPAAEEILARALEYYLDERFNITNRRLLGFA